MRLAQQRPALLLKVLSMVAKPVGDTLKGGNEGRLISPLQQSYRLTEALVIALNQGQIVCRCHDDISIQLGILGEQPPNHHQLQAIDRR